MNETLENWWAGLTVTEKERIGTKIARNAGHHKAVIYPECSTWWNRLSMELKLRIYQHCTDDHGLLLQDWKEGEVYSY